MAASPKIYSNIARSRSFDWYDRKSKTADVPAMVKRLKLERKDVAKLANVALSSVRYDDRMPPEIQERFEEVANIFELVAEYFSGETSQVFLWMRARNPLLGSVAPLTLIKLGKYQKVLQFIMDAREGNLP